MRFAAVTVGDFYIATKVPSTDNCTKISSTGPSLPSAGDIFKCTITKAGTSWPRYERQYSVMELWRDGVKTDIRYKYHNHSSLELHSRSDIAPEKETREQEKTRLEIRSSHLTKKIKQLKEQLSESEEELSTIETRLISLNRFKTDVEAIAHVIKAAKVENASQDDIVKMIQDAGIKLA